MSPLFYIYPCFYTYSTQCCPTCSPFVPMYYIWKLFTRMKQEAPDNNNWWTMKSSPPYENICAQPIMKFYHRKYMLQKKYGFIQQDNILQTALNLCWFYCVFKGVCFHMRTWYKSIYTSTAFVLPPPAAPWTCYLDMASCRWLVESFAILFLFLFRNLPFLSL